MWKSAIVKSAGGFLAILAIASSAPAIEINYYSPAANDRFSSGYPSAPVANTDGKFIGLGYDWSGVGWCSADPTQSVALLAPGFFVYANHYHYNLTPGSNIIFESGTGTLKTYTVGALSGSVSGNTDLGVGVLASPVSASDNIASYSILFVGYDVSNYIYSPVLGNSISSNLLVYGRQGDGSSNGPRIGTDTITDVKTGLNVGGVDHTGYYIGYQYDSSTPDLAHLEEGDSGSPSFFYDSAAHNLYLAGTHYVTSSSWGFDSSLPLMLNDVSAYMAKYGYLPSVYTPTTVTWTGSSSNSWGNGVNWSTGIVPEDDVNLDGQVQNCASLLLDAASASLRSVNLDGDHAVTGMTFANATGSNGFIIATGTSGTLTLGEAGIKNLDNDIQTFNCNIMLRSSQIWDAGQGGLVVTGSIDTNSGNLLLVQGGGNTVLSGLISNSGGLAKDGSGTLILSGTVANTYSGTTFIHNGVLQIGDGSANGSLGAGSVTDDAVLAFNRSDLITVSNPISGTGSVRQIGTGALVLSGSNSFTGTTTVAAGILQLANSHALGSTAGHTVVQSGGALDLNGQTIGAESLTISGAGISGIGALTNSNLSVTANYNGPISLGSNSSIGGSGNMNFSGTLNMGTYSLAKTGSCILTLTGSQIWGNDSTMTVLDGSLSYNLASGATTTVAADTPMLYIASGATVNVDASNNDPFSDDINSSLLVSIIISSSGAFNITAGDVSVGNISGYGSISVTGGATLTVSSITQSLLTIGEGSKVKIRAISFDGLPLAAASTLTAVPEPSVFSLLILAGISGLALLMWKCKFPHQAAG